MDHIVPAFQCSVGQCQCVERESLYGAIHIYIYIYIVQNPLRFLIALKYSYP